MTAAESPVMLEAMPELRWKLKEYLENNDVSAYSVAKETGLSLPSIYRLTNNHSRYIQFDTLISIMATIEKKTGKPVSVSDILEYIPDN
jgi:DNA-binding Xre family transcriptional regulator